MTLLFLIFFGFINQSNAGNDISVIDVRRNIPLSDEEPVYRDFYINGGSAAGFKKNLVVNVVRKMNVRDASGANSVGEILAPIGQLRVIAVYDRISVAREYKLPTREDLPMIEQPGIMNGDSIDLKGSFIDNSKPKPKKQVASESTGMAVIAQIATSSNNVETANKQAENILKSSSPPVPAKTTGETLEKTADSGNNTQHE